MTTFHVSNAPEGFHYLADTLGSAAEHGDA